MTEAVLSYYASRSRAVGRSRGLGPILILKGFFLDRTKGGRQTLREGQGIGVRASSLERFTMKTSGIAIRTLRAGGLALGLAVVGLGASASRAEGPPAGRIAEGRELFLREWTPGDPRSTHGDGLGPVFNDSSCVACHNSGGSGGGGPSSKNVDIVTAVFNGATRQAVVQSPAPAPTP